MFGIQSLSDDDKSRDDDQDPPGLVDFHELPQIQDSSDPCISNSLFAFDDMDEIPCSINNYPRNSLQTNACYMDNDNKPAAFSNFCLGPEESKKTGTVGINEPLSNHLSCCEATENNGLHVLRDMGKVSVSAASSQSDDVSHLVKTTDDSLESKEFASEKQLSPTLLEKRSLPHCNNLSKPFLVFKKNIEAASCLDSLQTSLNSDCEDRRCNDSVVKVNSEELCSRINERSLEAVEENLSSSSSSETQRIRRKRLYSFSSDSSSDADFDSSSSTSSNTDSSRSSSSSAAKNCKLDRIICSPAEDAWRQTRDIFSRQLGCNSKCTSNIGFQRRVGGSLSLVQRLHLYSKYERHQGCVNALNFNETGTLIASGSDDLQVVIWDWVRRQSVLEFDSGHRANVFQVKFMPYSGDCHIVSCARDGQVRLAQLSVTGTCKGTKKLAQHKGSAHKLAILPDSCNVFLSCGEDGVTYQIDLRQEKSIKLCTTKENGKYVALYSVHANPFNSYEYCVGGRDQYIRIYDSRKLESSTGSEVVKKFCPQQTMDRGIKSHVTCAVYNYNGTAILGTYNDDDIYLFDNSHSDGASHMHRYSGHRNSATVKGVNFYGPKSEYVVSGSDCGNVFLWDIESEAVVNYFHADENGIVNVLEPHPHIPMLATSGLDNDVKLWLPISEEPTDLQGLSKVISKNRKDREKETNEPELIDSEMLWFFMHRLRRSAAQLQDDDDDDDDDDSSDNSLSSSEENESADDDNQSSVQCSQS